MPYSEQDGQFASPNPHNKLHWLQVLTRVSSEWRVLGRGWTVTAEAEIPFGSSATMPLHV